MNAEVIENAKKYIKRNEGCRFEVYRDTFGHYTVGYGHKIRNGENFTSLHYTQEMIDNIFEQDFKYALYDLYQVCKVYQLDSIGDWRKIALLDMCYQMGLRGVFRFKKTLGNLEHHNFNLAAIEVLDSEYAKQTPNRARRTSWIFQDNSYPPETAW